MTVDLQVLGPVPYQMLGPSGLMLRPGVWFILLRVDLVSAMGRYLLPALSLMIEAGAGPLGLF